MKVGDTIKGPAFIRRRYKGEWEYAFLYSDGSFSPFGKTPPSAVLWVYQVTWKDKLQKIHRITADDRAFGFCPEAGEKNCWWVTRRGAADLVGFEEAWTVHTKM
jgi:hypothetical protein